MQYKLDVADLIDASGGTSCDVIGLHSPFWAERIPDCLRIRAYNRSGADGMAPAPVDEVAVADTVRRLGRVVGTPEMDQAHRIDPSEVRPRLAITPGWPVALHLPLPCASH